MRPRVGNMLWALPGINGEHLGAVEEVEGLHEIGTSSRWAGGSVLDF